MASCMARSLWAVHPHACGEYSIDPYYDILKRGSSPRLWGVLLIETFIHLLQRFIPTPVGSMDRQYQYSGCNPVHPHACGEYSSRAARRVRIFGSSPRLWGVSLDPGHDSRVRRFIPTPVGSILRVAPADATSSVHPHACGEYRPFMLVAQGPLGSSPRLWGVSAASSAC